MANEIIKRLISSIVLIPIVLFVIIKGSFFFYIFISICFLITLNEWYKMSFKKSYSYIGILFIILYFISAYNVRTHELGNYNYFLFVITICISTDIGGYIFGKFLKGPKLTNLSPNKTYSGMIGSYLLSFLIVFILISYDLFNFILFDFTFKIFLIIFIISSISQLGDIIVSYFKRNVNIKDTGTIIPGHGGLLDRIDGMIFFYYQSLLIKINFL